MFFRRNFVFLATAFFIVCITPFFSQEAEAPILQEVQEEQHFAPPPPHSPEPQRPTHVGEQNQTSSVHIRSNVRGAAIYLNGVYHGVTPQIIQNLAPGMYELTLKKNGYKTAHERIRVQQGTSYVYNIQLENVTGFIELSDLPKDCTVLIDGNKFHADFLPAPLRLSEGFHTVEVRKFGYRAFYETVDVHRRSVTTVNVTLEEADFEVTAFYASKTRFNPDYAGSLGSITFTAEVTAPEQGALTVTAQDGTEVFSFVTDTFSAWTNRITWNGLDGSSSPVPDGLYTATFTAGQFTKEVQLLCDHGLFYRLTDFAPSGSGFGTVPVAVTIPGGTTSFAASFFPVLNNSSGLYALPFSFGLSHCFFDSLTLSAQSTIFAANEDTPFSATFAAQYCNSVPINASSVEFCFGGGIHYGFITKKLMPKEADSYCVDLGAGLGAGLTAGISTKFFYAGLSTDFVFGPESSNPAGGDMLWKNGAAVSLMPCPEVAINLSCAILNDTKSFESLELGAGASFLIPGAAVVLKAGAEARLYFNTEYYISPKVGLTYLF